MSEAPRRAKKIGLTFVDGHVQAQLPTRDAYHRFTAAADAEKEEQKQSADVIPDSPSEEELPGKVPASSPGWNVELPVIPISEEEIQSVVPEKGIHWHWVEDAIGDLPEDVLPTPDEEDTQPAVQPPNTAAWTKQFKGAQKESMESRQIGRFNERDRNDYLIEQEILRGSDNPDLNLIDDELLDESDLRRLKREAKKMSEAEQEHQERLAPFLEKEKEIEDARFRNEQWLSIVTAGFAAAIWSNSLTRYQASHKIANVVTPYIRRKMAVWRRRAAAAQRRRDAAGTPKPHPRVLKSYGNGDFFLDWSDKALTDLIDFMSVEGFKKGDSLFHQGDTTDDIYFVADGVVDIVVCNGSSKTKPKSKLHNNGVVVATKHRGEMIGEGAHFTREPRCASAICMSDVVVFRVSRDDFVLASSTLPTITFERLRNGVLEQRASNLRVVFPLTSSQLQKISVFGCWHAAGLQELVASFTPRLIIKGEELFKPDDEDGMAFFIVSGKIMHTLEEKGRTVDIIKKKGEVVGEEELVFGEARSSRAICLTTCEVWCLDRATYLPLSMRNAICAVESRQIVNQRRAERLKKPPQCQHILKDHVLHFLVPAVVLESAWRAATPCVFSQGETICTEQDAARTIYVITSGTLYQRYGSDGPDAADTEGVKVQRHLIINEEPHNAFIIGAMEFGCGKSNYFASVRCTSQCHGWGIRMSMMENELRMHHPNVASAIRSHVTFEILMKHFLGNTLAQLDAESVPPHRAENRTGRWA